MERQNRMVVLGQSAQIDKIALGMQGYFEGLRLRKIALGWSSQGLALAERHSAALHHSAPAQWVSGGKAGHKEKFMCFQLKRFSLGNACFLKPDFFWMNATGLNNATVVHLPQVAVPGLKWKTRLANRETSTRILIIPDGWCACRTAGWCIVAFCPVVVFLLNLWDLVFSPNDFFLSFNSRKS